MAEEEYDPYALADAPALGTGTVTINKASFGYDAQYKGGEAELAILEGTVVNEAGETHDWRQFLSIGSGWSIVDAGARVERADGKPNKNFQKNCAYGIWLAGALAAGGATHLRNAGPPHEAHVWKDTQWEVGTTEHDYGKDIGKKNILTPVQFLGSGSGTKASTSTASPAAKSAAAPAASSSNSSGISASLKAKLKKLAKECESHDQFVDRAFVEVDGVDGNKEAESLVADSDDYFNELRAA